MRSAVLLALLTIGLNGIRPMISYRALELGANTAQVGLIAASYGVLSFCIAIPAGRWIDRLGEAHFIVAGGLLMTGMSLWLFATGHILALGIAQALLGMGQVFALIALQSLVANCGPPEQRDARFGLFAVMGSLGQIVGPIFAGFLYSAAGGSASQVFLVSGLFLVTAATLGGSFHRWPPAERQQGRAPSEHPEAFLRAVVGILRMRSMPQAMIASVGVLVTIDLLVAYLPVFGEANGIAVETVGLLLAARAAGSATSRILMVPLMRLLGRRRLILLSLALPAVALSVLPLSGQSPVLLFLIMTLSGLGLGLGQPISLAWVATAAPIAWRGTALGVRLTGNRLGQVLVPALVGAIGGATSVSTIFVILGVMLGGSAAVVFTAHFDE